MATTNSEIGAFINAQTEDTSPDGASDFVLTYDASATAVKKVKPNNLAQASAIPPDGWVSAGETWTYASATTFTISGDKTTKYQAGQKIKLTQTTVKYFIITAVSYGAPNTTVTIYGGTDYTFANAAVSVNYYSLVKAPFGFPLDPSKWSVVVLDTSAATQHSPADGTWYNLGTISIAIPIGAWLVSHEELLVIIKPTAATLIAKATLSTANNSESDADFSTGIYVTAAVSGDLRMGSFLHREKLLTLASATTYYLNASSVQSSAGDIYFLGSTAKTRICATCAYL